MNIQSAIFTSKRKNNVQVTKLERDYSSSDDTAMIERVYGVPVNSDNTDYQFLIEWVAKGNAISPYVAPPSLPERTNKQKFESKTGLTVKEIKTILGI